MSCLAVDENEFLQLLIAFDEMSSSSSDEEEQKERPRKRPFKHRKSKGVVMFRDDDGELKVLPPTMSLWYNMYCQTGCQERMSDFHSKFRRRFRLPYDQYRELVEMCTADSMKEDGTSLFKRWRPGKKAALTGKPAAPLELLVLKTLRYLGRGWTFDDLEECTGISEEVIRVFFHQFIKFGSTTLYNKTYNIVTSHRRKIFSTTDGHPARWNDKTLVRYDDMASTLHDGTNPLCNLIFELYAYDENDLIIKERYKGGWLIVDNGYLNWGVTRTLLSNTNPSARSYAGRAVDEEDYFQGSLVRDEDGAIIVRHMDMTDFRQRLITHFDIAFKKKEIIWPKARLQMDEPYANVQP
ncbi:hypothetical protein IV203_037100 [Nitzschia inconspicua]|uniref:Uncharacterized protein n=1 Tax=Nitzschia inconspicua TaxID=303405 RepID=A0A9K3PY16_9STRA|nr:hypothetical protein IV203_037100 [Nitzschia inconspicua]